MRVCYDREHRVTHRVGWSSLTRLRQRLSTRHGDGINLRGHPESFINVLLLSNDGEEPSQDLHLGLLNVSQMLVPTAIDRFSP